MKKIILGCLLLSFGAMAAPLKMASIEVSPKKLDFGVLENNLEHKKLSFFITNTGNDSAVSIYYDMLGVDFSVDRESSTCGDELAPAQRCQIFVVYSPSMLVRKNAYLDIAYFPKKNYNRRTDGLVMHKRSSIALTGDSKETSKLSVLVAKQLNENSFEYSLGRALKVDEKTRFSIRIFPSGTTALKNLNFSTTNPELKIAESRFKACNTDYVNDYCDIEFEYSPKKSGNFTEYISVIYTSSGFEEVTNITFLGYTNPKED